MIYTIFNFFDKALDRILGFAIDNCTKPPKFTHVPAPNNWDGIPLEGLGWRDVINETDRIAPIIPMTIRDEPETCPECGGKLTDYKSDKWEIEGGGSQWMVRGVYCKKGHYTHLDCA